MALVMARGVWCVLIPRGYMRSPQSSALPVFMVASGTMDSGAFVALGLLHVHSAVDLGSWDPRSIRAPVRERLAAIGALLPFALLCCVVLFCGWCLLGHGRLRLSASGGTLVPPFSALDLSVPWLRLGLLCCAGGCGCASVCPCLSVRCRVRVWPPYHVS